MGPVTVLRALLDPTFSEQAAPSVVGVLYLLACSAIGTGALVALLFIWDLTTWAGKGWWWFAPGVVLASVAAVLAVRVVLEVAMVWVGGPMLPYWPPEPLSPASTPPSAKQHHSSDDGDDGDTGGDAGEATGTHETSGTGLRRWQT